ncbi:hypothetical protein XSR1_120013 [Xenorhabdus szentirmaii DSM 16338]|uniref:Uncharacterized protein n=1 Tax=Xenorhabdus szentirmaii DSM 16338 TaxID=1427518 RepID=W1IVM9_9GAMM|nr:hypothetical protein XSR1_120013 [Xenorhabdus szentirmaii DSM 16338]
MGRQKAVTRARREVRRMLKKDMKQSRYQHPDNVTSFGTDRRNRSYWNGPRKQGYQ